MTGRICENRSVAIKNFHKFFVSYFQQLKKWSTTQSSSRLVLYECVTLRFDPGVPTSLCLIIANDPSKALQFYLLESRARAEILRVRKPNLKIDYT
jgi:hypothetical protein